MGKYVKHPKIYHLPWSLSVQSDDKIMPSISELKNSCVVVSEKMDGENTSLYNDHIHARSLDSRNHESRNWVKGFWASIKHLIPPDIRICGENVYAQHSIKYDSLPSYFLGFSAWRGDRCLDWRHTIDLFNKLSIQPVPVLYRGPFDEEKIKQVYKKSMEGYVVRFEGTFQLQDVPYCIGKFVRKNHVQTDEHWMHGKITPNRLKKV